MGPEKVPGAGMRNAHCTQDSGVKSLLTGDRFETMRSYHKKQDPPRSRASTEETPMPIVQADRLTRIGAALLKAAGASDEEARAVAVSCVNAHLACPPSHGLI